MPLKRSTFISDALSRRWIIPAVKPLPSGRKYIVAAGSLGIIGLVGLLDFSTGPYVSLTFFYLLPVVIATWFVSFSAGMIIGAVAVFLSTLYEVVTADTPNPWVPYFNGFFRAGILCFIVAVLSALRAHRLWLCQAIKERAIKLRQEAKRCRQAELAGSQALLAQREDFANQLHDGLAQTLTSIAL